MHRHWLVLLLACGCAATQTSTSAPPGPAPSVGASEIARATSPAATAAIEPRSNSTLSGSARFVAVEGGLGARVEVQGAAPGLHGVHVHEKGNCDDPKAASAGSHYNPHMGAHHGGPATAVRHGGDLGNIEVGADGKGTLDVVVSSLSVDSVADGVVGRAIVVHEKPDDLQTDPAGNSGARIGCGVIQAPMIR